jgi:hypothetical protein
MTRRTLAAAALRGAPRTSTATGEGGGGGSSPAWQYILSASSSHVASTVSRASRAARSLCA